MVYYPGWLNCSALTLCLFLYNCVLLRRSMKICASIAIFLINTLLVVSLCATFLYQLSRRALAIARVSRSLLHPSNL